MNKLIPELSFKKIENGDDETVITLNNALKEHGFFAITEHGLSTDVLKRCYQSSKDFFSFSLFVGSSVLRNFIPISDNISSLTFFISVIHVFLFTV